MDGEPRLLARLPKAVDLEVAIRLHEVDGRQILEFIDHVPSLDLYGRGYWIPLSSPEVIEGISAAVAAVAAGALTPDASVDS